MLAGSTKLARLACAAVANQVDISVWADVATLDFKEQPPESMSTHTRLRGLSGFSRNDYYSVKLSTFELESAIAGERSAHGTK